jgi:hypothetical protein
MCYLGAISFSVDPSGSKNQFMSLKWLNGNLFKKKAKKLGPESGTLLRLRSSDSVDSDTHRGLVDGTDGPKQLLRPSLRKI